jgi:glycosyltransferase involved in cell wall biosynthesis
MEPTLASRCAVVERVELPPARWPPAGWRHRIHVLSTPVTVRPSPVAAAFSRHFARAVREIAVAWKPDIIQIERDVLAYCLPFLNGVAPLARILVCHDPGLTASKDLAEMTVRRQKLAHRLDAATWRRYWARTLPAFDAVIAFTDIDIRALRGVSPGLRVFRIPLGIDLPRNPCNPIGAGEPDVLFIGGYAHQPNSDAATRLIRSIMPLARRRVPGLRLTLVGEKPTDEMRRMASADDVITGSVPSVTPYVDEASLVVLPIRVGGGMRVKLLESLAAGKAVVASRLAASGLNATHGRELVLAETDQEFADAIATLLGDEAARSKLAHAAREWACSSLTWESRVHEYERLYGHLLNSHG